MTIQIDSSDAVENEIDEHQQYKIENQNLKYSKNALSESIEQPIKNNETRNHNDKSDINKESATYRRDFPKVGRNDICPCGSDKKYKHCHGKIS
jgi:preprotein translocase subunit SecA